MTSTDFSHLRALIVEDEFLIAQMSKSALLDIGLRDIHLADSKTSALAICNELKPDLVLMDIRLSENDNDSGFDVAQSIEAMCDTTFVFVSAFSDAATQQRALQSHNAVFVAKPFSAQQLQRKVVEALSGKKKAS